MLDISFGECPVCRQGQLFAAKSNATDALLIVCDDCASQWRTPEQAQSYEHVLKEEILDIRPATLSEIEAAGWTIRN